MKRHSGSVKLSQSRGEAGNRRPSEGQIEKVRDRSLTKRKIGDIALVLTVVSYWSQ